MQTFLRSIPLVVAFILSSAVVTAQQRGIIGQWRGAIVVPGGELRFVIQFSRAGDSLLGTIDIPQQGAKGIPLKNISYADPDIRFELPTGGPTAIFEGKRSGDSVSGAFRQGGAVGTFSMRDGSAPPIGTIAVAIPPSYHLEEVTFASGPNTLAGTLTLPPGSGRYPAVVLVSGSGPQDRDETIFGFTPFAAIADALTGAGIAVLRYDDRGVAGSTGNFAEATTADFADDAHAAVRYLASRREIDPKRIGMLGHSEGGAIAPMVANRADGGLAFIVIMAGPGVKGSEIVNAQVASMVRAMGRSEEELRATLQFQERIYAAVRTGKGMDELEEEVRETARKQLSLLPAAMRDTLDTASILAGVTQQLTAARSPWFRYFIDADPAKDLQKVKCPVLALFGELDMQVPAGENKGAMAAALKKAGNRNVTIKVIPKANHLFQEARTGLPNEYATLRKEFIGGFLDEIVRWIQGVTRQSPAGRKGK